MGEKFKETDCSGKSAGFRSFLSGKFYTAKILFLGLASAQIIATIHIYLSNTELFRTLESIKNAGYLTVPNYNVMNSLQEFTPAFYGGLFFTLSTGALLSLLGLVSAFIWVHFSQCKKAMLIPFLILWAGLIGAANMKGFSLLITSYFLFIPSIVFTAASRWMPSVQQNTKGSLPLMIRIIPVLLTAILWILQINSGMFTNIRDFLLLSNGPGIKVNNFYYQYTMYPAEAIKSSDQKLINTYRLDNPGDDFLLNRIQKRLLDYDFLEVNGNTAVDLSMDGQNDQLSISNESEVILTMPAKDFLSNTRDILVKLSSRTDKKYFFRFFTYLSLYTGFPAVMIIFFYSILGSILNLFFTYRHAGSISLFLCLTTAIMLSALFYHYSGKDIEEENLSAALKSDRWYDRVMALKKIDKNKTDISRFGNYQEMMSSPYIPVRYWLAKVLGTGDDPDRFKNLQILMDDPSPNVVCMAYYSAGERGDKRNIKELLNRIERSDHWYEQWYAYRALRSIGWKQTISKQKHY